MASLLRLVIHGTTSPDLPEATNAHRSPASNLPQPVLDLLFHLVTADTFASLVVVNRHYRNASSSKLLYAYQLASFFGSGDMFAANYARLKLQPLRTLKRSFAELARREFFPVYRPALSTFEIHGPASDDVSSRKRGHGLKSHLSENARNLVVTDPSHVYVMDLAGSKPIVRDAINVDVRPDLVEIAIGGNAIATVASSRLITIYSLQEDRYTVSTTLEASQSVTTVALTPDGMTLAAAGERGMAIFSLADKENPSPRHIPEGQGVDHLTFAAKGTVLCGMRTPSNGSSQFFCRSLYFPAAVSFPTPEQLASAWMEQPLNRFDIDTLKHVFPADSFLFSKAYLKMLLFYNIESRSATRSISGTNREDTRLEDSDSLLLSLSTSLGLAATSAGGNSIRVARNANIENRNDAQDQITPASGLARAPFVDMLWDGLQVFCRLIEVSSRITELQWMAHPAVDRSYRQRLVTTSLVNSGQFSQAPLDNEGKLCVTFLDFGYHIQNSEQQKIVIDLTTSAPESAEHTYVNNENLTNSDTSPPSSASSLTHASRAGHSSITSDYKDFVNEEQPSGSFLPIPDNDRAADLIVFPAQRSPTGSASSEHHGGPTTNNEPTIEHNTNRSPSQPGIAAQTPINDVSHNLNDDLQSSGATLRPLPLATASTPDLLMQTQDMPDTDSRPGTQQRVRSVFGAARSSVVLSGQQLRRVFSGPLENPPRNDEPRTKPASPAHAPMVARTFRARPQSMALDSSPPDPEAPPRRRSLMPRPNSFHAGTILSSSKLPSIGDNPRILSRRSATQPLERPRTPSSQTGRLRTSPPESPSLPSPSHVLSLHRRQASGSISSVHVRTRSLSGTNDPFAIASHAGGSEGTTAPRAALGAYRRNTGTSPVSPWASTTMLTRGEPGPVANRRYSMPLHMMDGNASENGGTSISNGNVSLNANGRAVSAPMLSNPRNTSNPSVNSNGLPKPRTRRTSITNPQQPPPARLQEHSLPNTPSMPNAPSFHNENSRRQSDEKKPLPLAPSAQQDQLKLPKTRKAGRLSTIQSVASLMGAARASSGVETQPSRDLRPQTVSGPTTGATQDTSSKRRSILFGSSSAAAAPAPKKQPGAKKKGLLSRWRKKVLENLAGV